MKSKEVLKQLRPYKQGKQTKDIQKEFGLDYIVKLASNENPYGFSDKVKELFQTNKPDFNIYPDGYTTELRSLISETLNVRPESLIFGSGSEEIIQMLCRSYLSVGDQVIMTTPTFPQYKHYALIEGAEIVEIPVEEDGSHPLETMLDAVQENTKIIWLCSPNNPTGTALSKQELQDFLVKCPSEVLIVLDEAYYEFLQQEKDLDAIHLLNEYKNLIVLRTFSKAYGLAGLRIGYGVADALIVETLDKVRGPFNTTSLAQQAAAAAFSDQEFINYTYQENKKVLAQFQDFLTSIGWDYYPSEANFLLVKTPESGMDAYDFLTRYGFIVRPGELLGIPNTIRVTIGKEEDMKVLQSVLQDYHNQLN
ncbi:histidinol-phosphate transaminase [Oceanobacillus sp. J11TS1]|uniref:histidinol-phosphate transaminase n=1 Tax=Oceanobacillus sp. J11TS1 TaxID=2807191 RepID=UPI001B0B275C|nr:histidinol-phosphate transaminase [Oceanobacillus sp. J11TS1]GIO22627.1 histidinol-phosphate aminotransferase [Oceanobacillus sp. J11TS1]